MLYLVSPNYIGPLNGFVTTVFTIAALIAPYSIGVLTPHVNKSIRFYLTFTYEKDNFSCSVCEFSFHHRHIFRNGVFYIGLHSFST